MESERRYRANGSFDARRSVRPRSRDHPDTKRQKGPAMRAALDLTPHLSMDRLCRVCGQPVEPENQLPFNQITLISYGMCPSCRQELPRALQSQYVYRSRWLRMVRQIAKRRGYDYSPGRGFLPL